MTGPQRNSSNMNPRKVMMIAPTTMTTKDTHQKIAISPFEEVSDEECEYWAEYNRELEAKKSSEEKMQNNSQSGKLKEKPTRKLKL